MIKFFRKLRYKSMEENKTGKYLKYAIGEIILVVIGILIALSINNWNELRKNDANTVLMLKQLKEENLSNLSELLEGKMFRDSISPRTSSAEWHWYPMTYHRLNFNCGESPQQFC